MPVLTVEAHADRLDLAVDRAAGILRAGGVVAFPTETVYGLGADAHDEQAVQRIFGIKGRPGDNPLIVHVADVTGAEAVAELTPLARDLAEQWWPGPLTLVLRRRVGLRRPLASAVTAGLETVAVRAPGHPVAQALLSGCGAALAAPSANRSGRPSPTTAGHVVHDLGGDVDLVLDGGPCTVGLESTVVDARGDRPAVLREGGVTREQLGLASDGEHPVDAHRSPGTRHRHYAPRCAVEIVPAEDMTVRASQLRARGVRVGAVVPSGADPAPADVIAVYSSADDLAHGLFTAFRRAEARGDDVLLVAPVEELGLGRAVMDRLRRAAAGSSPAGRGGVGRE